MKNSINAHSNVQEILNGHLDDQEKIIYFQSIVRQTNIF